MLDEERDFEEEEWVRNLCPVCESSPCTGGAGAGSCETETPDQPDRLHTIDQPR